MKRILLTGSLGQIGSELILLLRDKYGKENVLPTDIREPTGKVAASGEFQLLDCTDQAAIHTTIEKFKPDTIYHLAALLSAVAEAKPQLAWEVGLNGLFKVLEGARLGNCAFFTPSSIGAFGPTTPLDNTPQDTIQRPNTMYGVTKVAGELLCDYYHKKYGVDTRGVRFPGIISYDTLPGGGTTDYAVDIFYKAIQEKEYTCFLKQGTSLDMMYMPDALQAAVSIMEADATGFKHRNAFNVTAMHFKPEDIAAEIKKHIPEFKMEYDVDPVRQGIAESWPNWMDDSAAREEWGWSPKFDLAAMTVDMLENLKKKLS